MNEELQTDELEVEIETDEVPYVEFDISVSPSDPSLELLVNQLSAKDIIIPFYQRKYVWTIEQASKLIESFLMGLPVPQIFLYVNNEEQLEVIDGQQRLISIKSFFDGFFGEEDAQGRRQTFKLKGLSVRSEYNDKKFVELAQRDQRKLKNSTLRAINIKQLKPHSGGDSVFHIFERLNTGGTRLKPQEIRNAVYRGAIVEKLKDLNANPDWMKILGLRRADKSQKDVELVLRLLSLFEQWSTYEKPMLKYLNKWMSENRDFTSETCEKFERNFILATKKVNEAIKKPFRPKNVINAAVLEAVMLVVLEHPDLDASQLANRYQVLLKDEEFLSVIRGATTDTAILVARARVAKRVLLNEPR
jgi:uncharacterized protein with ParB-like and HNH nuclease domain